MSTRANGLAVTADSLGGGSLSAQAQPDSIGLTVTRDSKSTTAPAAPAGPPGETQSFAAAQVSATPVVNLDNPNLQLFANGTPQGPGTSSNSAQATTTATPTPSTTSAANSATQTQTPSPTTTATPSTSNCDNTQSSLYCVYTVQAGDTLSGIASKFGVHGNDDVESWELIMNSNKPDITGKNDILQIDQKLRIPTSSAALDAAASAGTPTADSSSTTSTATAGSVIHTVVTAETISDIAADYNVSSDSIIAANKLSNPDALQIGQELLIPNPKQFAKPPDPVVAPTAAPADSSSGSSSSSSSGRSNSTASSPASVPVGAKSQAGFIWPVSGPISSYFGPDHPLGIDIDLFSTPNAPVGAAAAGVVTFAGGNACCSYGYYVIVDHGNGFVTLYAHFSAIKVSVGQKVSQGQVLGLGGRTGYATGNHLHFEVHLNGDIVNPLSYLP